MKKAKKDRTPPPELIAAMEAAGAVVTGGTRSIASVRVSSVHKEWACSFSDDDDDDDDDGEDGDEDDGDAADDAKSASDRYSLPSSL